MHVAPRTAFPGLLGLSLLAFSFAITSTADAQLHGREYSGVVTFDRWDSCYLISGTYVTYISKTAKETLRPYKGMAIHVHAYDMLRQSNPGDVLIRSFDILGPAPDTHQYGVVDGLELIAESDFTADGSPTFFIQIINAGTSPVAIMSTSIGPILLGPSPNPPYSPPADDISRAIVTHGNILSSPFLWRHYDGESGARSAGYTVDPATAPTERVQLAPRESMRIRISFSIPPGEYQFLFGYGGGFNDEKSLVSNAISFNLTDNGLATLVK